MTRKQTKGPVPITLTKDRDYLGVDYWTVSLSLNGETYEECASTRAEAVKCAAPLLAQACGVSDYYITEKE